MTNDPKGSRTLPGPFVVLPGFCWGETQLKTSRSEKEKQLEEYLTVDELSVRIKFKKQTLYNLIYRQSFVLGKHYLKPTPKKILFLWSEVVRWMETASGSKPQEVPKFGVGVMEDSLSHTGKGLIKA